MRILLIEDDPMIGEAVAVALRDAAYHVDWVKDGTSAVAALGTGDHQAVLLDLGLPDSDGLSVLRGVRSSGSRPPVIVITARDAIEERITALDGGADDYVVKPFDLHELLARLRAVLRRNRGPGARLLSNGVVSLDASTRTATRNGRGVQLTARECALLRALMLCAGRILTRNELEDSIYGHQAEVDSNAVDFLIHGVRRKLGPDVVKNVRGAGWMVAAAPAEPGGP